MVALAGVRLLRCRLVLCGLVRPSLPFSGTGDGSALCAGACCPSGLRTGVHRNLCPRVSAGLRRLAVRPGAGVAVGRVIVIQVGAHTVFAAPHILLLQQIAVFVVNISISVGAPAGVSVLLLIQHQGTLWNTGVWLILGGGRHFVKDAALGDGVDAIGVGTIDLHIQIPAPVGVIAAGHDLDGVLGIVFEPEVQRTKIYRGVHAQIHITSIELMVVPLHDLQRGMKNGIVNGGGGLADASADVVHRLSGLVGGGVFIALFRRTAAGGIVVGELLSR